MRGEEMPEGLALPDQMAYTALRKIYWMYHQKALPRDRAAAEKRRLRREWEGAVSTLAFSDKLARSRARILRETEAAKSACRKHPTPENALRLCNVLDGLAVSDEP